MTIDLGVSALASDGAQYLAIFGTLRLLPFTVYVLAARGVTFWGRCGVGALYGAVVAGAFWFGQGEAALWSVGGMGFFLLVALSVNRLRAALVRGHITPGALFVGLASAFLFLPGLLLPGIASATFLIVGWELLMSSYSYCVEAARRPEPPLLRDALFFLFVNPCLVLTACGARLRAPRPGGRGTFRFISGAAVLLANWTLLRPVVRALAAGAWPVAWGSVAAAPLYGAAHLLHLYASHSGLASVRIGLARQAGWEVPEAYEFPLLARSPIEFWQRWNRYVRQWLEAYVYFPVARVLVRVRWRRAGLVGAAMATLLASGLLHDGYDLAGHLTTALPFTSFFLASAAVLAGFRGVEAGLAWIRRRVAVAREPRSHALGAFAGRIVLLAALVAAAARWR